MIIAAAVQNSSIHPDYGTCEQFALYETNGADISLKTSLDFTGMNYDAYKVAEVLSKLRADAVFCGSIPKRSAIPLMAFNIAVIAGQSGDAYGSLKHYIMHAEGGCSSCSSGNCENCTEECIC